MIDKYDCWRRRMHVGRCPEAPTMNADQVAAMATTLAHYLSLLGMIPGLPGAAAILAGAAALDTLAANAGECQLIAAGATSAVQAFQGLLDWLRNNGHTAAATALRASA